MDNKWVNIIALGFVMVVAVLLAGCLQQSDNTTQNQTLSAAELCMQTSGMFWCDAEEKCINPRVETCVGNNSDVIVGGDRDAYGCIPSAGYTWCAEKEKCIRPWEENCTTATACTDEAKVCPDGSTVGRTGPDCEFVCPQTAENGSQDGFVGGDRDLHGCDRSTGYIWCDTQQKCIVAAEESCTYVDSAPSSSQDCMKTPGMFWCNDEQKCINPALSEVCS